MLFGGISIYLQQYVALFRKTPRFLDRLGIRRAVISAFASRSLSTDPKLLGDLTISMLEGERGVLRKEFDKLLEWLADEPVPDVINLPNSLLIGLARAAARGAAAAGLLHAAGRGSVSRRSRSSRIATQAIDLIRRQVPDVDRFIAGQRLLRAGACRELLGIPRRAHRRRAARHQPGRLRAPRAAATGDAFRVGYFARIAPEKGLHVLAEAYVQLPRDGRGGAPVRLEAAGYLAPRARAVSRGRHARSLERAGLAGEFTYRGAVDRDGKLAFLRTLDVLSVPATYDEPKGVFLLEAMASGVPVVQPRRGAFTEIVEKTGGGLLVAPDDPEALADGLYAAVAGPRAGGSARRARRSTASARTTASRSPTDRLLEVYESMMPTADRRVAITCADRRDSNRSRDFERRRMLERLATSARTIRRRAGR